MRVNVYAEEMPDDFNQAIEIHHKVIDGHDFTGLRIYLHMPVTQLKDDPTLPVTSEDFMHGENPNTRFRKTTRQVKGPFIHHPGDDDSSAVTFWGKKDLREMLRSALEKLDAHYAAKSEQYLKKKEN